MRIFGQLVRDLWPGAIAWLMQLLHEWGVHGAPWSGLGGP